MRGTVAATLAAACLLFGIPAHAQERGQDRGDDSSDERSGRGRENFALAVGVGLADVDSVAETYLTAALRIKVSGGYLEPEVGYWKASGNNGTGSDLLLGVNLIGVVPVGAVDTFIGAGAAAHRLDAELLNNPTSAGKQTKLGVNAQFGLDVYLTRALSLFGVGRFDLVQGARKSTQGKAYLGLRARF